MARKHRRPLVCKGSQSDGPQSHSDRWANGLPISQEAYFWIEGE